jgi:cyclophilin family peptidyl-prolyl cis-trans isomerase
MGEEGPNSFVMVLAPLSDMPHTIYTFLDLVDLNLFEGSSFIAANDQQIEGGSPNHADMKRSVKLYERYAQHGYHRHLLGYNEYSERHPHTPFTVGFSGGAHPGPTLVINMADNTEARGPQADGRGGEPCFGTIVSGFDTLERIQSARKSSDGYRFAKNVVIQTVRVIANAVER